MIEMKGFKNYEELKRALYALKLFGISANAFYAGESHYTGEIKVNGIGAELSPEEYKKVLMERSEKISQMKQDENKNKKEALKKVPELMQRAAKLMDVEKLVEFEKYVFKSVESPYHGTDVEDALDVMEFMGQDGVITKDIYEYLITKKTPYLVLVYLIRDYYSSGFYTRMETQKIHSKK